MYFYDDQSFWNYLGFEGRRLSERILSGAPPIYLWENYHELFDNPVDFSVDQFNSTANYYVTDWTSVKLYSNATALADITPTTENNQSALVLGVEGRALAIYLASHNIMMTTTTQHTLTTMNSG
jgi:hypothetical protein